MIRSVLRRSRPGGISSGLAGETGVALGVVRQDGAHGEDFVTVLSPDLGMGERIVVPVRMAVGSSLGGEREVAALAGRIPRRLAR